jgi:hypothetical protein
LVLIAIQPVRAQNQLVTRSHFERPLEATVGDMCANFAEAVATVDTKARPTDLTNLHSPQHKAFEHLPSFWLSFDTMSLLLECMASSAFQANWMQPWLSTNKFRAL